MSIKGVRRVQHGMSLIELIVFIVVISAGLAGVLAVIDRTVAHSADPLRNKQALAIADAMMEEILLKDFSDPGGPVEVNRQDWDNVDDYNGYGPVLFAAPNDLATPLIPDYQVAVAVTTPGADLHGVPAAAIRQIRVTVSYGTDSVVLTGYRFNL